MQYWNEINAPENHYLDSFVEWKYGRKLSNRKKQIISNIHAKDSTEWLCWSFTLFKAQIIIACCNIKKKNRLNLKKYAFLIFEDSSALQRYSGKVAEMLEVCKDLCGRWKFNYYSVLSRKKASWLCMLVDLIEKLYRPLDKLHEISSAANIIYR